MGEGGGRKSRRRRRSKGVREGGREEAPCVFFFVNRSTDGIDKDEKSD